ncbi:SCA7-domain-containing protein [Aureobasidium sp. EXF-3400]
MAPNGTGRKAPAAGKPKFNFASRARVDEALGSDAKRQSLRLKDDVVKRLPKASKPGNWDSDIVGGMDKDTSGVVNRVPMDVARAFVTGHPMQDEADIVRCNHCKRPVLRHKAKAHIEECIQKKQEKQRKKKEAKDARDAAARRAERENAESDSEEDDITMGSKTAGKNDGTSGKKRKAEDSTEGAKKKKKKDEPKAKAPRPKAPVDVEKQCGVPLANGAQCARSLTCKSHSMGAKRAVPGRSAPYDKLLAEYQRKNQAKLQKQALEAQQPFQDDEFAHAGPIDSDEEKDLVLAAIARSQPRPLWQSQPVPLKRKYQYVRIKEMMSSALGGKGAGLFRTGPPPEEDNNNLMNGMNGLDAMNATPDNSDRRMSGVQRTMTGTHSRKTSAVA